MIENEIIDLTFNETPRSDAAATPQTTPRADYVAIAEAEPTSFLFAEVNAMERGTMTAGMTEIFPIEQRVGDAINSNPEEVVIQDTFVIRMILFIFLIVSFLILMMYFLFY